MNPLRRQRAATVLFVLAGAGVTLAVAMLALEQDINLFYPPEQVVSGEAPVGKRIRAGGMVAANSVVHDGTGLGVSFVVTDYQGSDFKVHYEGLLPGLFGEREGVLVAGQLRDDGLFEAEEVLAKHDENYMPPEVAKMLAAEPSGGGGRSAADAEGTGGVVE